MHALRHKQDIAILHCDIVEFSRLTEQDEDGTLNAVVDGFARARLLVADHDGELINTAGDSLLAVFDTAEAAIQTAAGLQQHFALAGQHLPESRRIRSRIGIHLGEARLKGDQAFGNDVNITARLQERSPPGGVCLSQACFEQLPESHRMRCTHVGKVSLRKINTVMTAYLFETGHEFVSAEQERSDHDRLSILVLPEMAPDERAELLSVDIISGLSRFRQLAVLSPHTVLSNSLSGHSPFERARAMRVTYLVQTQIRADKTAPTLFAQLWDIGTGELRWARDFDLHAYGAIEEGQDVVNTIVSQLTQHIELALARPSPSTRSPTHYQRILKARRLLYRMRESSDILAAHHILDGLLDEDPHHAPAHSARALGLIVDFLMGWSTNPEQSIERAFEQAALAIDLDPMDSEAHAVFGITAIWRRHYRLAIDHLDRAIELNPSHADARAGRGLAMIFRGDPNDAFVQIQDALRYNPIAPAWYHWALAISCYNTGQYRNAVDALTRIAPLNRFHRRLLSASYAQLGDDAAAAQERERVMREVPHYRIADSEKTQPYQYAKDLQPFIDGLRRAGFE